MPIRRLRPHLDRRRTRGFPRARGGGMVERSHPHKASKRGHVPEERRNSAAGAARRATDDPSVFLIPSEHLPAGFAEKVDDPGLIPAPPRPAATVVLMRDADGGPEALLLRRHRRSGFAADAWVFPGGGVDKADREEATADHLDGPTPAEWA